MARCTNCNHEGAYIGYSNVECPNIKCKFFTELQLREWSSTGSTSAPSVYVAPKEQLSFPFATNNNVDSDDDGIAYSWVTHHHDFGDC